MEAKYSLVGVDGNAFAVMGYVKNAMQEMEFSREEIQAYLQEAMSSDYNHLLAVSCAVIDQCNEKDDNIELWTTDVVRDASGTNLVGVIWKVEQWKPTLTVQITSIENMKGTIYMTPWYTNRVR